MKAGHKVKFPFAIRKSREELKEQEEKAKWEKEEREKEQELAQELAKIERERKLFEAKARQLKVEDSKDPEDQKIEIREDFWSHMSKNDPEINKKHCLEKVFATRVENVESP